MLNACRYFGNTRDYWWANLTWALHAEMQQQLAEQPPTDRLIALYFAAQKWWSPPSRPGPDGAPDDEEAEVWDSGLPDVTE